MEDEIQQNEKKNIELKIEKSEDEDIENEKMLNTEDEILNFDVDMKDYEIQQNEDEILYETKYKEKRKFIPINLYKFNKLYELYGNINV